MPSEHARPEPAPFVFSKGTDVGRVRDHNEDYLDAFSPPDPIQRRRKGVLFIVADGMGGHQAGGVASKSAVEMVSHEYYSDPDTDVRASLLRAIKKANELIYEDAQRTASRAGMGTTIVAAVVRGRELHLANVGDSRAYMLREGKVVQATRDHSFVAEQVRAGLLTREEARAHPQRNVITRALGSKPEVMVDTYSGELQPGDTLLLCTDGLYEYVREDDLLGVLGEFAPSDAVPRLIAMARDRGGSDNISALVVRAGPPPAGGAVSGAGAQPTAPLQDARRKRRLFPWLVVGAAGAGLVGVAILIGAGVLLPEIFSRKSAAPIDTPSPVPTASTTHSPTASPVPTQFTPTVDVAVGFVLEAPADGAEIPAGTVEFRWQWNNPVPDEVVELDFVVNSDRRELCMLESDADPCVVDVVEGEQYEWWVEYWAGGLWIDESEHWMFKVGPAATEGPRRALTPMPTGTLTATVNAPEPAGGSDT